MEQLFGKLSLSAACETGDEREGLTAQINEIIKPPTPLQADDIYLGALYAASNQVNLQGGCFAEAELEQLAELVIGAPILVGHQKQQLPIGRAFKAELVTREDQPWLKVYFYWSRKQSGADQLKAGIDSGIYSECSLAFQYGKPECGICRADMRRCRHRIGQPVQLGGREIRAFYYYKELARVLEISLVYRGAVEGTKVEALAGSSADGQAPCRSTGQAWTPAGHSTSPFDPFWRNRARPIFKLTELEAPVGELIAEPLYNGLWCLLDYRDGKLEVTTPDGSTLDLPILQRVPQQTQADNFQLLAQVYPVKGGSRLPLIDLLSGKTERVRVAVFDIYERNDNDLRGLPLQQRKEILEVHCEHTHEVFPAPYQVISPFDLDKLSRSATSIGLLLGAADQSGSLLAEFRAQPLYRVRSGDHKVLNVPTTVEAGNPIWVRRNDGNRLRFSDICQPGSSVDDKSLLSAYSDQQHSGHFHLLRDQAGDCWLSLDHEGKRTLLRIRKLNLDLLGQRRHFWCESIFCEDVVSQAVHKVRLLDKGQLTQHEPGNDGSLLLQLNGEKLNGYYLIRPVTAGGKRASLFCHAAANLKEQHDGLE